MSGVFVKMMLLPTELHDTDDDGPPIPLVGSIRRASASTAGFNSSTLESTARANSASVLSRFSDSSRSFAI
ncbi:hypothetical protein Hanom_Chr03g00216241 [Helianthus anomalus]